MDSVTAALSAMASGPIVLLAPVLLTALLIFVNGVFVAAEFAIIGVRRTQMEQLAGEGNARARRVLAILNHPPRKTATSPPRNWA